MSIERREDPHPNPLPDIPGEGTKPTRWNALGVSIATSFLFLLVYNLGLYLASRREHVGTWVYDWEKHIPFVPWMIWPYLSIDLFFVVAPFLCSTKSELKHLAQRLTAATLVAGAFFILMPLRYTFERPPSSGLSGWAIGWFTGLDKPFNLFPSLHIAYRTILAEVYDRHTRGPLRWMIAVWFTLVGLSTLLIYQHHVVDVIGGFALGALCFYFIGDAPWRQPAGTNPRVATYFAVAAIALLTTALATRGLGWLLAWPAIVCGVMAWAYLGLGPAVYRKHAGRLPWATRVVLLPVLIGQWWSWRHYGRMSAPWNELTDRLWIGRLLKTHEAQQAIDAGVVAVVDLTCEFSTPAPFRDIPHLNVRLLDLTAPPPAMIDRALAFIAEHSPRGIVYVHCKAGYSRTAAIAGAHLLHAGDCESAKTAIDRLIAARPGIVIRPEARRAIEAFAARQCDQFSSVSVTPGP
jgi:protein-tyrosine phosphatase/membrane-associated phospholipid phosphatase